VTLTNDLLTPKFDALILAPKSVSGESLVKFCHQIPRYHANKAKKCILGHTRPNHDLLTTKFYAFILDPKSISQIPSTNAQDIVQRMCVQDGHTYNHSDFFCASASVVARGIIFSKLIKDIDSTHRKATECHLPYGITQCLRSAMQTSTQFTYSQD